MRCSLKTLTMAGLAVGLLTSGCLGESSEPSGSSPEATDSGSMPAADTAQLPSSKETPTAATDTSALDGMVYVAGGRTRIGVEAER